MSQETKSITAARKLVMERLGYTHGQADHFVRVLLRNDLSILRRKDAAKFILGSTRMFLDGQLDNALAFNELNTAIRFVADHRIHDYDRDMNGLSCDEFIRQQSPLIVEDIERMKKRINAQKYVRNYDYEILKVESFEDCKKFEDYTSWCISHLKSMYDNYSLGGMNQFYILLKKGYKDVPKVKGPGYPNDSYGLSMITLSINVKGNLNTCTMRWDHDVTIDCDHTLTEEQLSRLVGANFYEIFKPSDKGKELKKLIENFQRQNGVLETQIGKYSFHVFDANRGIYEVKQEGKYNYGENKGGKRTLIGSDGKMIMDKWVNYQFQVKIPQEYLDKVDPKRLHKEFIEEMKRKGKEID